MKWHSIIQQRLGWKLFFSYLIIVVSVTSVLTGTAEFYAPNALLRHLELMQDTMGHDMIRHWWLICIRISTS